MDNEKQRSEQNKIRSGFPGKAQVTENWFLSLNNNHILEKKSVLLTLCSEMMVSEATKPDFKSGVTAATFDDDLPSGEAKLDMASNINLPFFFTSYFETIPCRRWCSVGFSWNDIPIDDNLLTITKRPNTHKHTHTPNEICDDRKVFGEAGMAIGISVFRK